MVHKAVMDGIHHTVHGLKDFAGDGSWLVKQ
jgi:hypothetical protein